MTEKRNQFYNIGKLSVQKAKSSTKEYFRGYVAGCPAVGFWGKDKKGKPSLFLSLDVARLLFLVQKRNEQIEDCLPVE